MNTYRKVSTSRRRAHDVFDKKALALGIALALSAGSAHAVELVGLCTAFPYTSGADTGGNFTMLDPTGGMTGGTNDLVFSWTGSMFNASSDYTGPGSVSNARIESNQAFNSNLWTAHDVQVFAPSLTPYSFNTATGGGNGEAGIMNMTVGTNQIGMHMLFDWGGNTNIDVAVVLKKNGTFGSGYGSFTTACTSIPGSNCLWNSGPASSFAGSNLANRPLGDKLWMLASDDGDGDGTPGIDMAAGGPFQFFSANFNFNGTLLPLNDTCGMSTDSTADLFTFTGVTNAAFNTLFPSNSITVNGLGASIAVPISITGGGNPAFSLDGGTSWHNSTVTNLTVQNNNTVMVRATSGSANGSVVTATLSIGSVTGSFVVRTPPATNIVASNFTMIDKDNGITGGANDVAVGGWTFASTNNTTSTGTTINVMTLTTNTPFKGAIWTAHDIRVFDQGTYTFNTGCTITELQAGGGACAINGAPLNMTVGANQLGAHMLFDWNGNTNIDVAIVWNKNQTFGPSPMYTGGSGCSSTVWELSSTDPDNDGKNGIPMVDGPFKTFNANFNLSLGVVAGCDNTIPSMQAEDTNVSKGVGCTLSTTPVNPLERGDWWLLLGFVAWMGGLVAKRKRA